MQAFLATDVQLDLASDEHTVLYRLENCDTDDICEVQNYLSGCDEIASYWESCIAYLTRIFE